MNQARARLKQPAQQWRKMLGSLFSMRWKLLAVAMWPAVLLAGCQAEKSSDLLACRAEAERFYPSHLAGDPAEPAGQFVVACMASKRYSFSIQATDCDGRYPMTLQSTCYSSDTWASVLWGKFRGR